VSHFRLLIAILIAIPTVQAADITYNAPSQDEKTRHIETGSRAMCQAASSVDEDFQLAILVPKETGYTLSAQPTLYWSVSKPVTAKFKFFIEEIPPNNSDYIEPIVEDEFELKNASASIQVLSLSEYGVELKKDTDYRWSLRLLCDPQGKKSAADPSANTVLKYITPSSELSKDFEKAQPEERPHLYAENGFWIDAFDALSQAIQAHPDNKTVRELRAQLLEQVELPKVAVLDRQ